MQENKTTFFRQENAQMVSVFAQEICLLFKLVLSVMQMIQHIFLW